MKLDFVRPEASQLAIRLFDRALHPELFTRCAEAVLKAADFTATVRICDAGHTVQFRCREETLTEVVGPYEQLLPERGRCFGYRLRGSRDAAHALPWGIRYQCSAQAETLEADLFTQVHEELAHDARRAFLAYEFPGGHRFAPSPLSLIQAELTAGSLSVHAFHTFPENLTVLRTQSLFEF
jgi:hypothetical protein